VLKRPRLILAGLGGGSGKTILTLGLLRAWVETGRKIKPFKKGPDYIDATWLGLAARTTAVNLDPFFLSTEKLTSLFFHSMQGFDAGLVEGNRGLFDGKDVTGSYSTAELARILDAPVVLVVDCTKVTRTVAALVKGCRDFEPGLNLAGVILNRTAGPRHRQITRQSVETYTGLPVMGVLPKIKPDPIPERHMGLISDQEYLEAHEVIANLAQVAADCLDLDGLYNIARSAPPMPEPEKKLWPEEPASDPVRIGVIKDAALWFYYGENFEALRRHGAELVELSLINTDPWPEIHGLYLGGGFPETQAHALSQNRRTREHVRALAQKGLPIYAECGGFMYLGEKLVYNGQTYPMAGILPVTTELCARPQGHGYTLAKAVRPNPYHPVGLEFTGHEFHYSRCAENLPPDPGFALEMVRGCGICRHKDGLITRNTFAGYTHLHALAVPTWAENFIAAARICRDALAANKPVPDIVCN